MNQQRKNKQMGAAILVAMLVVTLVATLAAGLQWRQWRAWQSESAARIQSQASWVLVGALDWARLILREDARSAQNAVLVDHLSEPWALPLQEAKLSTFLSTEALSDAAQDEAYLSGQILDAQAKINLTNLNENGALNETAYRTMLRLYQQLGLPVPELQKWTAAWVKSTPPLPIRPSHIEQLVWLGMSESSLARLRPYIIILPQGMPINLNTASALVIHAVLPNVELANAQQFVASRDAAPLQNIAEAGSRLGVSSISAGTASVSSQFFEVRGRLRLGEWILEESSLVQRFGLDVKTVWRKRGGLPTYN
jgi:general secretion pathway protein K